MDAYGRWSDVRGRLRTFGKFGHLTVTVALPNHKKYCIIIENKIRYGQYAKISLKKSDFISWIYRKEKNKEYNIPGVIYTGLFKKIFLDLVKFLLY